MLPLFLESNNANNVHLKKNKNSLNLQILLEAVKERKIELCK